MKEKSSTEELSLPENVEQSLCECGGIKGLVDQMPDDSDIEALCDIYRALADYKRMKILAMLSIQPFCVCVIKEILKITDSRLSYHLSVLKKAGLISGEQDGSWIIYSLTERGRAWFSLGKL